MIRAASRALACALMFAGLAIGRHAAAQSAPSFSADLIRGTEGATAAPVGRLSVAAENVRLDTQELADGYFITNSEKPAAVFVRPSAQVYMDARQSSRLIQQFVRIDPADPCRQWQAMARLAGGPDQGAWQCEQIGNATIGGRASRVYLARSDRGEQFTAWIDPQLGFPLQIKLPDGVTFTLEHIQERLLSPDTFEIPSGFRKFDPQALLERVKQSDVWVQPQ
jgi:hypothetical protein